VLGSEGGGLHLGDKADHYTYDPRDVSDFAQARARPDDDWLIAPPGANDLRGSALVYHSDPLPDEIELTGAMRLSVWLAMDVPDTDLRATVYEITADGQSILLGQDMLRARYRESLSKEALVPVGVPVRYGFEHFPWLARRLAKGSRLRLVVGAVRGIMFERNYNAGGAVAEQSGKDARVAHVTLLHDAEHPSSLDLPLGG